MPPQTDGDHKKLLTEVIKKQIVILGPDITLAKARNVKGMTVANDGTVTDLQGDHQEITQELINQFMELSGLIVKKTMEPLLANYPNAVDQQMTNNIQQSMGATTPIQQPVATNTSSPIVNPIPQVPPVTAPVQPAQTPSTTPQTITVPTPSTPTETPPTATPPPTNPTTQATAAINIDNKINT